MAQIMWIICEINVRLSETLAADCRQGMKPGSDYCLFSSTKSCDCIMGMGVYCVNACMHMYTYVHI